MPAPVAQPENVRALFEVLGKQFKISNLNQTNEDLTAITRQLVELIEQYRGKRLRMVFGNTSFGVYKKEWQRTEVLLDIRLIAELRTDPVFSDHGISVAAGTTYSELLDLLQQEVGVPACRESQRVVAGLRGESTALESRYDEVLREGSEAIDASGFRNHAFADFVLMER